jgi:hypothetical protein
MRPATAAFIKQINHPVKFRMFLFYKLPSAFFSGVRVRSIDDKRCVTSVPYKWLTQNPFRSTYFASLAMAAEMSTGVLALAHLHKRNPPVSLLVIKVEGNYYKKATSRTYFTCEDGDAMNVTIEKAIASGEGHAFTAKSTGKNEKGEIIAEFFISWSFKARSSTSKIG